MRELKDGYGKYQALFVPSITGMGNSSHFLVINRMDAPGKFRPVFKTETQPQLRDMITFNMLIIDTDTLCDNVQENEILF